MIHKKLLGKVINEFQIREFIEKNLNHVGLSSSKLKLTPLGEKIIISASRPGLIVGRKGQSIKKLTALLKKKFKLENPQIEINEVENVNLDAEIVAERIVHSLERFGSMRFKSIGHRAMEDVMNAGGLGVEILISGKIPSSRAKRWRFYTGYLKKSGDAVHTAVKTSYKSAELKTGLVGIQVRIMLPNVDLPDKITFIKEQVVEEVTEEKKVKEKTEKESKKKESKKKEKETKESKEKPAKKTKKKVVKTEEVIETKSEEKTESKVEEKVENKETEKAQAEPVEKKVEIKEKEQAKPVEEEPKVETQEEKVE